MIVPIEAEKAVAPGPIHVLLIDDHEMVAEGLALALARFGIALAGRAVRLDEGVDAAATLRPDVVLLDFRLPDGNALDGLRQLAERAPGVPVLVLTATTDPQVAVEVLRAGAAGYLTKDLPVADLARAVAAAARHETVIVPGMLPAVMAALRAPMHPEGSTLTAREREVLSLLGDGLGVDEIAKALDVSRNTARKHVQAVLMKLNAHTQLEAVAIARRTNLFKDRT